MKRIYTLDEVRKIPDIKLVDLSTVSNKYPKRTMSIPCGRCEGRLEVYKSDKLKKIFYMDTNPKCNYHNNIESYLPDGFNKLQILTYLNYFNQPELTDKEKEQLDNNLKEQYGDNFINEIDDLATELFNNVYKGR